METFSLGFIVTMYIVLLCMSMTVSSITMITAFCHDRDVALRLQDSLYGSIRKWLYYHTLFPVMCWEIRSAFKDSKIKD